MATRTITSFELTTLIGALEGFLQGLKTVEVATRPEGAVDFELACAQLRHLVPVLSGAEAMLARIAKGDRLQ